MDNFARALISADNLLQNSPYRELRRERYSSFDKGAGAEFELGKLTLEDLRTYAINEGEPKLISGQQEFMENLVNRYI